MAGWQNGMVSMELDDDDKLDLAAPVELSGTQPDYPWGLRLCLTHRELGKLGLEADCSVGDTLVIRCCARVMSVSRTDGPMGPEDRVELQITDMACEGEDDG